MRESYDIFISYRREGGDYFAQLLYDRLISQGYRVFLDVESLRSGKFNEELLRVIDKCKDFILVLPENALERCSNPEDWVRREVVCAINKNKNIIPVWLRNFSFPDQLPSELSELPNYQCIKANDTDTFSYALKKLYGYLSSKPGRGGMYSHRIDTNKDDFQKQEEPHTKRSFTSLDRNLFLAACVLLFGLLVIGSMNVLQSRYHSPSWMPVQIDQKILLLIDRFPTKFAFYLWLTFGFCFSIIFCIREYYIANHYESARNKYFLQTVTLEDLQLSFPSFLERLTLMNPKLVMEEKKPLSGESDLSHYQFFLKFKTVFFASENEKKIDLFGIDYWNGGDLVCLFALSTQTNQKGAIRILSSQGFLVKDSTDDKEYLFTLDNWVLYVKFNMIHMISRIIIVRDEDGSANMELLRKYSNILDSSPEV